MFFKGLYWHLMATDLSKVCILKGSSAVISVPNGSLYIFDGRAVEHGTTRIARANRLFPSRIGLVFYRYFPSNITHNLHKSHPHDN